MPFSISCALRFWGAGIEPSAHVVVELDDGMSRVRIAELGISARLHAHASGALVAVAYDHGDSHFITTTVSLSSTELGWQVVVMREVYLDVSEVHNIPGYGEALITSAHERISYQGTSPWGAMRSAPRD